MRRLLSLPCALLLAACGGTAMPGDRPAPDLGPGTDAGSDAGPPAVDAGPPHVLEKLISGTWSVPPGMERYVCVRKTMTEAIDIHRFHPVIPMGTHHTVLSFDPTGSEPDGTTDCTGFTQGPFMLFGSGVGTGDLTMPDGISVHVEAGQQLILNLHLFNLDATHTLTGTSATEIERMDPATVTDYAEVFLAGIDTGLTVPGHMTSTAHGTCSPGTGHIFAVSPHMHQTGVHQTVTLMHHDGTASAVLDTDYSFDLQQFHPLTPMVDIHVGDHLLVDCTYDNPGATEYFGEHTTDEMCFAAIYRYPSSGALITCTM